MHVVCLSSYLSARLSVILCAYSCKQYAYLPVSLSDWARISARICRDKRIRKMIVLPDAYSPLRLGGGRRAGLQRSEVVWEWPPHIERRTREDSLLSVLYKATWRRRDTHSNARIHSLRAPALSLWRVFLIHLRMRKRGGKGLIGNDTLAGISPALHPAGRPSHQTCCRCRPI